MKNAIPFALSLGLCACSGAERPPHIYRGEAFLLSTKNGKKLLIVTNPRATLVVSDLPESFTPATHPASDTRGCVFDADVVSVVASVNRNSGQAAVQHITVLRPARADEVGYVSPSFSSDLIC